MERKSLNSFLPADVLEQKRKKEKTIELKSQFYYSIYGLSKEFSEIASIQGIPPEQDHQELGIDYGAYEITRVIGVTEISYAHKIIEIKDITGKNVIANFMVASQTGLAFLNIVDSEGNTTDNQELSINDPYFNIKSDDHAQVWYNRIFDAMGDKIKTTQENQDQMYQEAMSEITKLSVTTED